MSTRPLGASPLSTFPLGGTPPDPGAASLVAPPGADTAEGLRSLPLLRLLPESVRELVARSFVPQSYAFGQLIIREGEPADAFFVLATGQARVVKAGLDGTEVSLNLLRPGDAFGEAALLEGAVRSASVRASGDVEVLRLDRAVFQALAAQYPELAQSLELQTGHRDLQNFLRLFTRFSRLPAPALLRLLALLQPVQVPAGTAVLRQGDAPGAMYVVQEGRLRVFADDGAERRYLAYLRRGDYFGERSLLRGEPRAATVEALTPCTLLRLDPGPFARLLAEQPEFRAELQERVAQYDYQRTARVPLDFADQLLPADARAPDAVGPGQLDAPAEPDGAAAPGADQAAPARGPFASADGHFVKGERRVRRMPFIRQIDEIDCGAAALAMICRHFGRAVPLGRVRRLVHTSCDGTSLRALCRAATELGLAARAVKASPQTLTQMPLPAIVHYEGNHWVVLYDVTPAEVRVADPAVGLRRVERGEFEARWTGYAALFDYTAAFEGAEVEHVRLGWLWPFFRPYVGALARAFGLAVLVSGLQMVLPVFTQIVVDRVLVDRDATLLNTMVLGMLAVFGFSALAVLVQRYLISFAAVRIDAGTLDFVTRRLLQLPTTYFASRRTGDIQRRLTGLRQIRQFVVENAIRGVMAVVQLAAALVVMFAYNAALGLTFLAIAPAYLLLMYASAHWLRPVFAELEEGFGRYFSRQIDAIKGIETVKAAAAEGTLRELMLEQFHGLARRQFRADFIQMCYDGATQLVTFGAMALFLWLGARQVMSGSLTLGGLVAFNSLVALANAPLGQLLGLWDGFQISSVLMHRVNDILDEEPEQGEDRSRLVPVRTLEGGIRARDVAFRYGGPESTAILEGITFDVLPGQTVAIVGRSGSGKTTLTRCLAGLLEPTTGTILYDGLDLRTLNYRDLRRQIGYVLQQNHLFEDTIARNIALGEGEPDMDRVMRAARTANAHGFIERLPLGYDTRVGETGIALSGGQRQLVALARALYSDPPVLILDEATSALDAETERGFQENLAHILRGRTTFVIAHRLSTIRDADRILVLDAGRLAETGTHDELIERRGLYYYLCGQQLEMAG